eukprot:COSAG02_NODE_155_length_33066_cov_32.167562_6_plen_70_part_00
MIWTKMLPLAEKCRRFPVAVSAREFRTPDRGSQCSFMSVRFVKPNEIVIVIVFFNEPSRILHSGTVLLY